MSNVSQQNTVFTLPTISAYDLYYKDFPPPDFIVPDILPKGLIIVGGRAKIGKSWLFYRIGISIAQGGKALEKWDVKQGSVLYLSLEDTEFRLHDRLHTILPPGEEPPKNLTLAIKWDRLSNNGLLMIEQWIKEHPDARLIIIDTWAKIKPHVKHRAGNTGYDADYEAVSCIKELADRYSICILLAFHLRKEQADDPLDELNATSGAAGCADGAIILKRTRGQADATLFATGRDYREEQDLALSFNGGLWRVIGAAEEHSINRERKEILDLLRDTSRPLSPKEIAETLRVDRNTIRQRLHNMEKSSQVKNTGSKYTLFTTNTTNIYNTNNNPNSYNSSPENE